MSGINKVLKRISGSRQLINLELIDCKLNDESLGLIGNLPNLETLDISLSPDVSLSGLNHLKNLHHLVSLGMKGCPKLLNASSIECLKSLGLRSINVDQNLPPQLQQQLQKVCPSVNPQRESSIFPKGFDIESSSGQP